MVGFRRLWILLAILLLLILLFGAANGQTGSLGIHTGDTFTFACSTSWQSNQTGVTPPSSISNYGDLQVIDANVTAVTGVSVTANYTYGFTTGLQLEISTADYGGGYVPTFIPPNLGTGDLVPSTSLDYGPKGQCYLNGTEIQSFGNITRTFSHLQVTFDMEGFQGVLCDAYWDQATGVRIYVDYSFNNQTGENMTAWWVNIALSQTNAFGPTQSQSPQPTPTTSVPEMTTTAAIAVLAAAATVTSAAYLGRMRSRT
jgi:hypothetical protein